MNNEQYDLVQLVCPRGHKKKMAISKSDSIRHTYCQKCFESTIFTRAQNDKTKM